MVATVAGSPADLDWPTDRLPAIPCYEFSGMIVLRVADEQDDGWRS